MIPVEIINGGWESRNATIETTATTAGTVTNTGYLFWVILIFILVYLIIYLKRLKNEKTNGYNF